MNSSPAASSDRSAPVASPDLKNEGQRQVPMARLRYNVRIVDKELTLRAADAGDAAALADLIRLAYRGDEGWTTEAAFLDDERIDAAGVTSKIADPDGLVLVADSGAPSQVVACCEVVHRGGGLAYFGMFAVSPALQAAGLGRRILAAAEGLAVSCWRAHTMEMTVIGQRTELIAWYMRRGYKRSDEIRPFPYDRLINGTALRDDLYFVVLIKQLSHP